MPEILLGCVVLLLLLWAASAFIKAVAAAAKTSTALTEWSAPDLAASSASAFSTLARDSISSAS